MAFEAPIDLKNVVEPVVRLGLRMMPGSIRRCNLIARLELWVNAGELKREFDAIRAEGDRHGQWLAMEKTVAILDRLDIPHPGTTIGPENWRSFLSRILVAAYVGDITQTRAIGKEWSDTTNMPSDFGAPGPASPAMFSGPPVCPDEVPKVYTARSAGEIFEAIGSLTSLRLENYARPHIGKWLRVQSVIRDINVSNDGNFVYVMLGRRLEPMPYLRFERSRWGGRLETMDAGDVLATEGEITHIEHSTLYLDNCEIVALGEKDDTLRH